MSVPFHLVELALYAENTAVIATSLKPVLRVSYMGAYFPDLERWLRKWTIAVNFSKSTTLLFICRRIQNPRLFLMFGVPNVLVDTARYLVVTLDKRLTWSFVIDQVRKKTSQRLGILDYLLNKRSGLSSRNGVLLYRHGLCVPHLQVRCMKRNSEGAGASIHVCSHCCWFTLVHKWQANSREFESSVFRRPHQSPDWEFWH
jgi:hypothetical protein